MQPFLLLCTRDPALTPSRHTTVLVLGNIRIQEVMLPFTAASIILLLVLSRYTTLLLVLKKINYTYPILVPCTRTVVTKRFYCC